MQLTASRIEDIESAFKSARKTGTRISSIHLPGFQKLLDHHPENLTATVEAGMTLQAFQEKLRTAGQWVAVDPPNPERLTIGALIAANVSGPRRFGFGTVREHLIGMKAVLADGSIIRSGGKVVKNVAGFDICRLFVGSRGSLGIILEATFRLNPLPESEMIIGCRTQSSGETEDLLEGIMKSDLNPMLLDLHNLGTEEQSATRGYWQIIVGFAGTREDNQAQMRSLNSFHTFKETTLDYLNRFWNSDSNAKPETTAVRPSEVVEYCEQLGSTEFVTRAGNGVIHHHDSSHADKSAGNPQVLLDRLKSTFDPESILAEIS